MNAKTKMERIINSYTNIGEIVVLKEGQVQYETYRNSCNAQSTLHIYSVTKSIISILIGIAIDKGYIESINQRLVEFFPEYFLPNITIKNFLTMTVPYKFKVEPYTNYFTSDDWVDFSLKQLGREDEIGKFRYAPLIGPDILSGILTKATDQSVLDFATQNLFSVLGIKEKNQIVFQSKDEQMKFYDTTDANVWVADHMGINAAGWGLTLTAMDMAKIGQLYLQHGNWEGRQIVSSQWVIDSTTTYQKWERLSYGYLWWIIDKSERAYAALGDGGNVVYVNEKKGLVIAIASLFMMNAKDRLKLIRDYIEPVFEKVA